MLYNVNVSCKWQLEPVYLESLMHLGGECEGGSFLVPVWGFEELARGRGYPWVLRVVRQLDFILGDEEHKLSNVLARFLLGISVELLNHFLKGPQL